MRIESSRDLGGRGAATLVLILTTAAAAMVAICDYLYGGDHIAVKLLSSQAGRTITTYSRTVSDELVRCRITGHCELKGRALLSTFLRSIPYHSRAACPPPQYGCMNNEYLYLCIAYVLSGEEIK